MIKRPTNQQPSSWPGHLFVFGLVGMVLIVFVLVMSLVMRAAALSDEASGKMLAVFEPSMAETTVFTAIIAAGGNPIRSVFFDFVWIVEGQGDGFVGRLKSRGALGAYEEMPFTPQLAGCFAFADAKVVRLLNLEPH